MDVPYRIRSAVPADAVALVSIERRCFSDPWSESSFREALESPWSFGLVAHTGQGVAGYLIGREVAGTGEVLNLAVAPEFRRKVWPERCCGPDSISSASVGSRRSIWKCASPISRPRRST